MIALAAIAFAVGIIFGSGHKGSPRLLIAEHFAKAWAHGDYAAMYADIDETSRREMSASALAGAYRAAMRTATETGMVVVGPARSEPDGTIAAPVRVRTRLWGTLHEQLRMRVVNGPEGERVRWSKELVFPGLREGESLSRQTKLPPRATLLARDGSVLADGEASGAGVRSSPLGVAADAVIGEVGPIPASRLSELEAEGVPTDAVVGTSGLERALDESLRGTPGGELLAGGRVLATAPAKPSPAIRTTISASLQRTAATALGGQFGGIVAMNPSNGEILAVAGIGIDDLQPPGSTFKMVTLTAALEAKVASERSVFGYATSTTLDGVKLENANGESCGGAWRSPSRCRATRCSPRSA